MTRTKPFLFLLIIMAFLSASAAWAEDGVTLYENPGFLGVHHTFSEDDPDIQGSYVAPNTASSLKITDGWSVTVYEFADYEGRSETFTTNVSNLNFTDLGDNNIWSLKANPPGTYKPGGVTLYTQPNWQGVRDTFHSNRTDLQGSYVGNNAIQSLKVEPGWSVTIYEFTDFQGRHETFDEDRPSMASAKMGPRKGQSIKVYGPGREEGQATTGGSGGASSFDDAVTLFSDARFEGHAEGFREDISDMKDSKVGNDRVSSIRVPAGWVVTVYEHKNFEGRAETFKQDVENLEGSHVGNDSISSMKVYPPQ